MQSKWMAASPRTLSVDAFCRIMTAFPTGVAIVTTTDEDGRPVGLTTNALMSVSADPPILAVSVGAESRTLPSLQSSGRFCVNFMGSDAEEICRIFASKADDKFERVGWGWTHDGVPVLVDGTTAVAECVTESEHEIGDHVVIAGRVVGGLVPANGHSPLLYVQRAFRRLPSLAVVS